MTDDIVVRNEPRSMLALIAEAAANPTVDVAKMAQLLEMQERMEQRQSVAAFNEAFARLQPRLPRVKKNGQVWYPIDKNKPDGPSRRAFRYSRWDDIDLAIRPLLNDEGFSLSFDTAPHSGGGYLIVGKLLHSAGHEKTASFGPVPLDTSGGKNNLQGAASSLSYGKRHTASMLLNLVFEDEDDDGAGGPINEAQSAHIRELLPKANRTEAQLLRYIKAESIEQIPSKKYLEAVSALKERIKPNKGEQE
jgi:hypothetical protein